MDILKNLAAVVEFLGRACGENCEIVLQDLREGKRGVIAIANGHVSGRSIGAPPTDFALRLAADETWKTRDYICNYEGKTKDNRTLRSSTFFIKNRNKLLGLLCVNIDAGKYQALSEAILRLSGLKAVKNTVPEAPPPGRRKKDSGISQKEKFYNNIEETVKSVLRELGMENTARAKLSQEERLVIVERLVEHGIFLLRGSVSSIAEKLHCSEASIYRYIATINRRKHKKG
jgi:predicted transcriptional regulator YheO